MRYDKLEAEFKKISDSMSLLTKIKWFLLPIFRLPKCKKFHQPYKNYKPTPREISIVNNSQVKYLCTRRIFHFGKCKDVDGFYF